MIKISIQNDFAALAKDIERLGSSARRAAREALNRSADHANLAVQAEINRAFDRPLPFTVRSLRVYYANTQNLTIKLWFRQRRQDRDKQWASAQIEGGQREMKPMELRLQRIGILPKGWYIVPGEAAPKDAYGNMSGGEISRILNVLGSYTESGFNKANINTRKRLARGNAKKGVYGFEYIVVKPNDPNTKHLQPGVYRRVKTGFGSSLKPMMIFVRGSKYKPLLQFERVVRQEINKQFSAEYDKALKSIHNTGSASGLRRGLRVT